MNILAIDLGTQCGWAISAAGAVAGGSENFAPSKHGSYGHRWLAFRQFLTEKARAAGGVHTVYFEHVKRHEGVLAAHAYGGFLAMLQAWCVTNHVAMNPVGVGEIKKHWTGKGNANKEMMVATARAKGFTPVDDNHADALAILALARHIEGK